MNLRAAAAIAAWTVTITVTVTAGMTAISALGGEVGDRDTGPMTMDQVQAALASRMPSPAPPSATPTRRTPSARPSSPAPAPTVTVTEKAGPVISNLSSPGGDVLAVCNGHAAHLKSWMPNQGFSVVASRPDPPGQVFVQFESPNRRVTIVVSCTTGAPVATITLSRPYHQQPPDYGPH